MQLKIDISSHLDPKSSLYDKYSKFLFKCLKEELSRYVRSHEVHYSVREQSVISSSLFSWSRTPSHLDIPYYIENCLVMRKVRGVWIISLDRSKRLPHSKTRVSVLVRALEFGTSTIEAYPIILRLFHKYQNNLGRVYLKFMKARLGVR